MSEAPTAGPRGQPAAAGSPDPSGGGGSGFDLPTPSKRTMLLVGVLAVVAVILWRRFSGDDGGGDGDGGDAEDIEVEDPEAWLEENAEEAEADGTGHIEIPVDPESELEKDEAVIEALKESGHLEVLNG